MASTSEFAPKGVIVALLTPTDAAGRLLEGPLRQLLRHVLAGGVHGVFVVGTTGEYFRLPRPAKLRVAEIAVEEVNRAVPIYFGASAESTSECVELARDAERAGADALTVLTPRTGRFNEQELYEHYRAVADGTNLPIILYGNPAATGVPLSGGLVRRLAEIGRVVGIKDSSGDLALTSEYVRGGRAGFSVLAGNDALILPTLFVGGRGAAAASANIAPRLVVSIYEDFLAGRYDQARAAQGRLALLRGVFALGSVPAVMLKTACRMIGLDGGVPIAPSLELPAEHHSRLLAILKDLGVL